MTVALNRLIVRSRLLSRSSILIPVVVGVALGSATPALASAQVCKGTLLQLQVRESGSSASDRFRFSLGLQAEAPSKEAAMALLNQRLDRARQEPEALRSWRLEHSCSAQLLLWGWQFLQSQVGARFDTYWW